jgi:oxygen-independent coproporphyrinogen III oxidase
MAPELAIKHSAPVPRYTSYPTAPHFSAAVDNDVYQQWLSALPQNDPISLYVHVPFCDQLCWYCGCSTKATRRYEPIAAYMDALLREIDSVAKRLGQRHSVKHIHWGGGSPNVLEPQDILRLAGAIGDSFTLTEDMEFAVEVDPRRIDTACIDAFSHAGVTRVSLGVQDFDMAVQKAINRIQSFDDTREALDRFRQAGVHSVNIDLVYGLPHQTRDSVARTIDQVLELSPDRIALFGYAHLPERLPHQRLIDTNILPGPVERFAQSNRVANHILDAGYVRVGLDHFAKPSDPLASQPVKRNFQGYTNDDADTLIGFGASAIGRLPQGYVQNAVPTSNYMRAVQEQGVATARGYELSEDDRARALVINGLMCDLEFRVQDLSAFDRKTVDTLSDEATLLIEADTDGLIEKTAAGFRVTEKGRPFVRSICSCFDAYLEHNVVGSAKPRYSVGV